MSLDQEKRVIVAFALSFVMLILWRVFFVKEPPPQPKKATPAATRRLLQDSRQRRQR